MSDIRDEWKENLPDELRDKDELSPQDRMEIPRQDMPEQDPEERTKNFDEVNEGFGFQEAIAEAERCLVCPNPKCVPGCPVEVDIPKFIDKVRNGEFIEAYEVIRETNALPAVCGRVCPQEEQCEETCVIINQGEPVGIGRLERFVSDYYYKHKGIMAPDCEESTGMKAAVVGAGPSGVTCAGDLALKGHDVTVFEALHEPGGVLAYGIPEFRLPNEVIRKELGVLEKMGVKIETNKVIGKIASIDELLEDFDTVFLGTGAGLPFFVGIKGENLNGVYSANEFLTRVNLMKGYKFPEYDTPINIGKKVAVIGGGNTAMDAVRSAKRCGAEKAMIVYRRSRKQAPARVEEIKHAEEEGIELHWLQNPIEFLSDDDGWVRGMRCRKMELGEPDSSGRKRPIPIDGSEFSMDVDTVILAIGQGPNPLIQDNTPGLETTKWENIITDDETLETSKKDVFAGGDVVRGGATVILAMGDGKRAARAMHERMMEKKEKREEY